jgi:class 3 adenylate cyclase
LVAKKARGTAVRTKLSFKPLLLAALFADLEGFSATATALPPERRSSVLDRYFTAVSVPVVAQGGIDTGATLELLSASEDGGFLSLSCKVSAQVGPSDDRGRTIDLSASRELEVSFSGVIEGLGD